MTEILSAPLTLALGQAGLSAYALLSCIAADRFSRCPPRKPVHPSAFNLPRHEEVQFYSRDRQLIRLSAWYVPAPKARGAVVMVHGLGMNKGFTFGREQMPLVQHLLDAGLSILTIDLRGHGHSDAGRLTYGHDERLDVLGAVDWLLERGYAPGRIGLLGGSMGAVASIAAAAEEQAIGAVVADSAYADFGAMLWRNFLARELPGGTGRLMLPGTLLAGRALLGTFIHKFNPAGLAQRHLQHKPLLLIHAEGDRIVPVSQAYQLAKASQAQLWITSGGEHLSSFKDETPAYVERVSTFLRQGLLTSIA